MKTEVDSEIMLSQGKENLGLPELGGPRQELDLKTLREHDNILTLDFETPNCEIINFCYFRSSSLWYFVMAALRDHKTTHLKWVTVGASGWHGQLSC